MNFHETFDIIKRWDKSLIYFRKREGNKGFSLENSRLEEEIMYRVFVLIWILLGISVLFAGGEQTEEVQSRSENVRYIRPLHLPDCDPSDPEVVLIRKASDWKKINRKDKRIFCVAPGNYKSLGAIRITTSGTRSKPRYLILDNGNREHPAHLVDDFVDKKTWINDLARYRIKLVGADYWIIDRQAYWNDPNPLHSPLELRHASHNLLSRALFVDIAGTVGLYHRSDDNTFQRFHMEKTRWAVDYALRHQPENGQPPYEQRIFADLAAFVLVGNRNGVKIRDNRFIANEIINFVDAFQTCRCGEGYIDDVEGKNPKIDGAGTVVAHNLFYTTPLLYVDEDGTFDESGDRALTENALDFKFGSLDPDKPIKIEDNVMFGYRQTCNVYSDLDDYGYAIVFHYGAGNIRLKNNVILDSVYGFGTDGPRGGDPAMYNVRFVHNIFYGIIDHISDIYGSGERGRYDGSRHVVITRNIFGPMAPGTISLKAYNARRFIIRNNDFVQSRPMYFPDGDEQSKNLVIVGNTFYDTREWGIPDYAKRRGNRRAEEAFDWDPYRHIIHLRRYTRDPVIKSIPF